MRSPSMKAQPQQCSTVRAESVLTNDTDVDLPNDTLTVVSVNGQAANIGQATATTFGTVTLGADGTFNYTHDGSENFSDSLTYTIEDAQSTQSTATVTITIIWTNDAPAAVNDAITLDEGATATMLDGGAGSVLTNDTDADLPNDTLTVVSVNGQAANIGQATATTFGTVTLGADGTFNYTHDGSENFSDSLTYTIEDAQSTQSTATVTITITPVNDNDPVAVNDAITLDEGATATVLDGGAGSVLTNDTDVDLPNDTLTVVSVNGQAANIGQATATTFGTVTLGADGDVQLHPRRQRELQRQPDVHDRGRAEHAVDGDGNHHHHAGGRQRRAGGGERCDHPR